MEIITLLVRARSTFAFVEATLPTNLEFIAFFEHSFLTTYYPTSGFRWIRFPRVGLTSPHLLYSPLIHWRAFSQDVGQVEQTINLLSGHDARNSVLVYLSFWCHLGKRVLT